MTKDELKKEAEKYLKQKLEERKDKFVFELPEVYIEDVKEAYLASAKPREKRIAELEAQIEKMQEKLKADLIANLKEQMQYSTSPSCTKGMELFIRSIEKWEIKEK